MQVELLQVLQKRWQNNGANREKGYKGFMTNLMNLLLGLKDNSFESFMREKTIKFEPDFKLEETMEEKCTVCGAESQADCKCPDDCPSCGA